MTISMRLFVVDMIGIENEKMQVNEVMGVHCFHKEPPNNAAVIMRFVLVVSY